MFTRTGTTVLIGAAILICAVAAASNFTFFENDTLTRIQEMKAGTHNPYREFNQWVNDLFYGFFGLTHLPPMIIQKLGPELGYYMSSYLRDYVAGLCVYWITAGVWAVTIYWMYGNKIFTDKGRKFPSINTIVDQILLANSSLPMYAALPIFSEFLIESKITRTYFYVDEVGGMGMYFLYLFIYIVLVEIGIYWMHRTLHENKWMFTYLHALHHKYKTAAQMTPFCSIAFNPIDGILQASPYVVCLFLVPVHYYTHVYLLFNSGLWATCIHDSVPEDTEPFMGAKYHTIHHTHYHYNYGQFFVFCDQYWGTLRVPKDKEIAENPVHDDDDDSRKKR